METEDTTSLTAPVNKHSKTLSSAIWSEQNEYEYDYEQSYLDVKSIFV